MENTIINQYEMNHYNKYQKQMYKLSHFTNNNDRLKKMQQLTVNLNYVRWRKIMYESYRNSKKNR